MIIVSTLFLLKTDYKHIKLFSNLCVKMGKFIMIVMDMTILLLTIIVSSKNCTITIIVKENITVNRQNRLVNCSFLVVIDVNMYACPAQDY